MSNSPRPKANKKPHPRFPPRRNAAPPAAPRPPRTAKTPEHEPLTATKQLLCTAGGALGASLAGSLAARWGLAPGWVAAGLAIGGGAYASGMVEPTRRTIAAGAASAGGSQLMLMLLGPALSPTPTAPAPAPKPTTVVIANQPPHKNADLGSLPPGMLHGSFERARAELAIADQVHEPYGFADHHHHAA